MARWSGPAQGAARRRGPARYRTVASQAGAWSWDRARRHPPQNASGRAWWPGADPYGGCTSGPNCRGSVPERRPQGTGAPGPPVPAPRAATGDPPGVRSDRRPSYTRAGPVLWPGPGARPGTAEGGRWWLWPGGLERGRGDPARAWRRGTTGDGVARRGDPLARSPGPCSSCRPLAPCSSCRPLAPCSSCRAVGAVLVVPSVGAVGLGGGPGAGATSPSGGVGAPTSGASWTATDPAPPPPPGPARAMLRVGPWVRLPWHFTPGAMLLLTDGSVLVQNNGTPSPTTTGRAPGGA